MTLEAPDSLSHATADWEMQPVSIRTRWAAEVCPSNTWREYPRPQMVRATWKNLNGLWEYAITQKDASAPEQYEGYILVPYPVESALSGVKKCLRPDQLLWYRRRIHLEPSECGQTLLLHFGAVDYHATVYMNEQEVGSHSGGYQAFTIDITHTTHDGINELVVKVYDPTNLGSNAYGKQHLHPNSMFYSASSGIWQTVWIEYVPSTYIASLKLTPDIDRSELQLKVALQGDRDGYSIEAIAYSGDRVVACQAGQDSADLQIPQARLWSPDDPYLYDIDVRLLKHGQVADEVRSYFGLRKIRVKKDADERPRIFLNDRYTYNLGVVDQGFWPDGLYTAPSDAALRFDVQAAKSLGFNTIRKHIKIEPERWYYHCDRLGLMVWQDMPSASNDTPEARIQFEQEIKENLTQLQNHPCITTWVIFNEGWGAYEPERLAKWIQQTDPSRLVNGHSGPYDQLEHAQWLKRREPELMLQPLGGRNWSADDVQRTQCGAPESWMAGDMADIHIYPGPEMFPLRIDQASVAGEHGSFGVYVAGHVWDELDPVGTGVGASGMKPDQMLAALTSSTQKLNELEAQGMSGANYFQLVDVEGEQQGFLTYDRAAAKIPVTEVARLNAKIVPRAANYDKATDGFFVEPADWISDAQRLKNMVKSFRNGRRDPTFISFLSVTALRAGDRAVADEACDEYIAHSLQPYTKGTWESIVKMTTRSQQRSFELLRTSGCAINALLGDHAAEKHILDIVGRELIGPYFRERNRQTDWNEFEQILSQQYGALGREAVLGAYMMDRLLKKDWVGFGKAYLNYFSTALHRSPYPIHSLSYQVLKCVNEMEVIESAVRVMSWQIGSPRSYPIFGQYDPTELDTYANLLHKLGRKGEALDWQQRAFTLSDGRDPEIAANLRRMMNL